MDRDHVLSTPTCTSFCKISSKLGMPGSFGSSIIQSLHRFSLWGLPDFKYEKESWSAQGLVTSILAVLKILCNNRGSCDCADNIWHFDSLTTLKLQLTRTKRNILMEVWATNKIHEVVHLIHIQTYSMVLWFHYCKPRTVSPSMGSCSLNLPFGQFSIRFV